MPINPARMSSPEVARVLNSTRFGTVVSHDAAPESIIKIKYIALLILAPDGFHDVGQTEGVFRYGLQGKHIFIHMPESRIAPSVQTV